MASNTKISRYPLAVEEDPTGFIIISIFDREKSARYQVIDNTGNTEFSGEAYDAATISLLQNSRQQSATQYSPQVGIQKLEQVIVLPMPMEYASGLSAQYAGENLAILSTANSLINDTGGTAQGIGLSILKSSSILAAAGAGVVKALGGGNKAAGVGAAVGGFTGKTIGEGVKAFGLAQNDRKEQFFQGVDFRQYTFSYLFSPKNKKEADSLLDIIKQIRFYAAPELTKGNLYYIVPAEFEIRFIFNGKENDRINKIDRCVLRNVSVNYTPKGKWSPNTDGTPSELQFTMEFVERTTMVRQKIQSENGGGGF